MALTFPLDLRTAGLRLQRVTFSLSRSVATAKLLAGLQAMEIGPAIWRASIAVRPEREHGRRRAMAFVDALSGTGTALVFSPAQCWPAAHPGGAIAGTWYPTQTLTSRTETSFVMSVSNGNLRIRAGDLVGLEQSGRFGLFRALADAAPVGLAMTVQVAPRIPSFFGAGATVRLEKPVCEMMLDPASEAGVGDGLTMEPVSFSMIQKVA